MNNDARTATFVTGIRVAALALVAAATLLLSACAHADAAPADPATLRRPELAECLRDYERGSVNVGHTHRAAQAAALCAALWVERERPLREWSLRQENLYCVFRERASYLGAYPKSHGIYGRIYGNYVCLLEPDAAAQPAR